MTPACSVPAGASSAISSSGVCGSSGAHSSTGCSPVSSDGASTWVARTTSSPSGSGGASGSWAASGSGGSAPSRRRDRAQPSSEVDSRRRRLVSSTPLRAVWITPAIVAPVISSSAGGEQEQGEDVGADVRRPRGRPACTAPGRRSRRDPRRRRCPTRRGEPRRARCPASPPPAPGPAAVNRQAPPLPNGRPEARKGRITTSAPAITRATGTAYTSRPMAREKPSTSASPTSPPPQSRYTTEAMNTPSAVRARPIRSKSRCSSTGRRIHTPAPKRGWAALGLAFAFVVVLRVLFLRAGFLVRVGIRLRPFDAGARDPARAPRHRAPGTL